MILLVWDGLSSLLFPGFFYLSTQAHNRPSKFCLYPYSLTFSGQIKFWGVVNPISQERIQDFGEVDSAEVDRQLILTPPTKPCLSVARSDRAREAVETECTLTSK